MFDVIGKNGRNNTFYIREADDTNHDKNVSVFTNNLANCNA